MVQSIDDIGDEFAHVTAVMPGPVKQLLGLIDEVGGVDSGDDFVLVGFVELVQAAGEETEGRE